uniref:Uncharacterized protein n=1 Tax=Anguilla anguilla TaxID=7936 RepID=A0A0E9Q0A1_ANGAN
MQAGCPLSTTGEIRWLILLKLQWELSQSVGSFVVFISSWCISKQLLFI